MKKINHILVTKDPGTFSELVTWCTTHAISLTQQSFITVTPILNLKIPKTEWVFFSSPQGTENYLSNYPINANKIAAVGTGTARILEKSGLKVDFIGQGEVEIKAIGKTFNKLLRTGEKVLFPCSQISKRSVIDAQKEQQRIELVTYNTINKPVAFKESFDVLFFTSPSNFNGYLENNTIADNALVIAIGKTTQQVIANKVKKGIEILALESPTEKALISLLTQQVQH